MRRIAAAAALAAGLGAAFAASAGEEVTYTVDGTTMNGYIARPTMDGGGKHAGVLVVHEWWGNNAYTRERAEMLAGLGYVALALDMYGEGKVADHPSDAGKFAGEVRKNMDVAEARFRAAMELLQSQPDVDGARIGAIGYCFGGGVVLEMARRGLPLAGVASFHGSLGGLSPVEPGMVKAEVLVLNGAADPFVKPEQIAVFKQAMDAAGAGYTFVNYPDTVHSFTSPEATANGEKFDLPLRYDPQIDAHAWEQMRRLFERVLR
jgi:dienelactone hydrolase